MKAHKLFAALAATVALGSANATLIVGGFDGVVNGAEGFQDGIDLSTLSGQKIHGEFSYETAALVYQGPAYLYNEFAATPLIIKETILGHTFTVRGSYVTSLEVRTIHPIPALPNIYTFVATAMTPRVDRATLIIQGNDFGNSFLSNPDDLGTMDFSSSSWSANPFYNSNGFTAFVFDGSSSDFSFSISSAFGHVAPIPEPQTYALMLAGLAAVGAAARRRKAH